MLAQAEKYGAVRELAEVTGLRLIDQGFGVRVGEREIPARSVLLATGVVNNRPDMPGDIHDAALARGLLRYCPICDAYEVTDRRIGVIGTPGADGSTMELELPAGAAGSGTLKVYLVTGPDLAKVQIAMDGKPAGGPVDLFAGEMGVKEVSLDAAAATAGGKVHLVFTVAGKNPAAKGRLVAIDALAWGAGK